MLGGVGFLPSTVAKEFWWISRWKWAFHVLFPCKFVKKKRTFWCDMFLLKPTYMVKLAMWRSLNVQFEHFKPTVLLEDYIDVIDRDWCEILLFWRCWLIGWMKRTPWPPWNRRSKRPKRRKSKRDVERLGKKLDEKWETKHWKATKMWRYDIYIYNIWP